ncbi:GNAT family N-acetyltransferase [Aeromonas piscicola]|uniref:GNAT family N-acetyltransferase n=1 Tax=Aeromonas piscicola TaxID=600645 RepID=UPI0021F87280|nr:GNAT family N-acetyltransferase [Aeromonas piscicola]MCW0506582.1 GNAT family N-acetyltransferase [Aeromonas piscicola]
MELIQLNENELKMLRDGQSELKYMIDGIPPNHVLDRSLNHYRDSICEVWSLPYFIKSNDQLIGSCGFKNPPIECRVEIGYNVAFGVQGKGIATFAVNKLCQIAFESGLVKFVFALISSENSASLIVVRKNGFIYKNIVMDSDGESLECWELSNNINALENP